jgi:hypothetical protein
MGAPGIIGLVSMLLIMAISLSSNGRERMDVQRTEDENKYNTEHKN